MKLPDDNNIVLPVDNDSMIADGSELPAPTVDDARALLPLYAQAGADAPVRAGVLNGFRNVANFTHARVGLVLSAQRTPRHASGSMLDWWGPIFGRQRAPAEGDPSYRQRLLTPSQMVTPVAIKGAVNALVAQYTPQPVNYQEPMVDAMFMGPASATDPPKPNASIVSNVVPAWQAFIQSKTRRLWANYPDRPSAIKTGAYLVPVAAGATIWVTLPGQPGDASSAPHCSRLDAALSWYGATDFIGGISGDSGPHRTVIPSSAGTPPQYAFVTQATTSLNDAVASEIEQRRAHGVRAFILTDPLFLTAL